MLRVLALPVVLLTLVASQASQAGVQRYRYTIQPLSKPLRAQLTFRVRSRRAPEIVGAPA